MVCFVHDRQCISKFHAGVNKLWLTNQFTAATLRQLPKQCCSCPEKRKDMTSTGAVPLLTSLDFDALQLICRQLDLKQCINTNVKVKQQPKILKEQEVKRRVMQVIQTNKPSLVIDSEEKSEDIDGDLVDNVLASNQTGLRFLSNRFDNSSKRKQPARTHRRQHILALALAA